MGPGSLVMLVICGIAFAGGGILLSRVLATRSSNPQKGEAYECGVPAMGRSWIQFNVGYYLFAILFLIFDVELVFLYPW
ncbi:MAG: NADH-quinone oxidoreductase subunit A, partial [Flavobacteriales bacterium]